MDGMDGPRWLSSRQVRQKIGNVSRMTLWRYQHGKLSKDSKPEQDAPYRNANFPSAATMGNRWYWREDEIDAWLESRRGCNEDHPA